jgi:hypothetical protein
MSRQIAFHGELAHTPLCEPEPPGRVAGINLRPAGGRNQLAVVKIFHAPSRVQFEIREGFKRRELIQDFGKPSRLCETKRTVEVRWVKPVAEEPRSLNRGEFSQGYCGASARQHLANQCLGGCEGRRKAIDEFVQLSLFIRQRQQCLFRSVNKKAPWDEMRQACLNVFWMKVFIFDQPAVVRVKAEEQRNARNASIVSLN